MDSINWDKKRYDEIRDKMIPLAAEMTRAPTSA